MVKIYCLKDPRTLEIYYIGKTVRSLETRLSDHVWDAKRGIDTDKCEWVRSLLASDCFPLIEQVEECLEASAHEREKFWIEYHQSAGASLTNGVGGRVAGTYPGYWLDWGRVAEVLTLKGIGSYAELYRLTGIAPTTSVYTMSSWFTVGKVARFLGCAFEDVVSEEKTTRPPLMRRAKIMPEPRVSGSKKPKRNGRRYGVTTSGLNGMATDLHCSPLDILVHTRRLQPETRQANRRAQG